jgi:cytochrome c oxidase subunit 2
MNRAVARAVLKAAARMTAVGLLAFTSVVCAADRHSVLEPAGPQAGHIHALWLLMLAVCSIVLFAVTIAVLLALRRATRPDAPADASTERGRLLAHRAIAVATGVSVVLLVGLFGATVAVDRALAELPLTDAVHIRLTGHQWWWEAIYDDPQPANVFATANELHIPVGRPVLLTLEADDVIHSFWVPNLGGKKDMIPGRTATLALRADAPGVYRGQCAEFCGYQHAKMVLLVIAEAPASYAAWIDRERRPAEPPADDAARKGQQLFMASTCALCHAVAGTDANGQHAPDLTHVASRLTIGSGALRNDASTLAAWITDPQHIKPGVKMPPHRFNPEDMQAVVAYLRTLR